MVVYADERLLLDVIAKSNLSFSDWTLFFGLLTGEVDEIRLGRAFTSSLFYERHPLVVLIGQQTESAKRWRWCWCIVCYLCDTVTQWQDTTTMPIQIRWPQEQH